jgi:D-beta-D-heptose 7-phosphate kinase/D-beta-D-heptose 1-phosphate adenosyltransferase
MDGDVVAALSQGMVLVVGDVMLDRFAYGAVERISPEAPVPILKLEHETSSLGGAGNVAHNVASLGGRAVLVGAAGHDAAGSIIVESLCPSAGIDAHIVQTASYLTSVKTRFVCEGHHILRVDSERTVLDDAASSRVYSTATSLLSSAYVMVLSDYAKGVLTPAGVRTLLSAAKAANVPVIVDPKSVDLSIYRHADLITPNAAEATAATGHDCSTDAGAGRAADAILKIANVRAVLITRGGDGMTLLAPQSGVATPQHIPAMTTTVNDVSGAGDTVTATVALALSVGIDIKTAVELACTAAAIAVGRPGTAAASTWDLRRALAPPEQPIAVTWQQAASQVRQWQDDGLTVGFANGCFDLMHPGHVALLQKAREQCDRLVVAINSDASVNRLKGAGRPIQDQSSRAAVIAALRSVDLVTLFDENTPLELIKALRPDVLIKGDDYTISQVVGCDIIQEWGGRVSLIPVTPGHSTSLIARRLERVLID